MMKLLIFISLVVTVLGIPRICPNGQICNRADCIEGSMSPNLEDCTKYYVCEFNDLKSQSCPNGLHWSVTAKVCDWPWLAGCDLSATQEPPSNVTVTSPPLTEGCPIDEDPSDPTLLPHPTNCSLFLKCLNGVGYEIACPVNQIWNDEQKYCDWPENTHCPLSNQKVFVSDDVTTEPNDKDPRCPDTEDDESLVFLPHETDCTKFYKCSNGYAILFDCPDNLYWNQNKGECDYPEEVNCQNIRNIMKVALFEHKKKRSADLDPRCPETDDPDKPFYFPHESDCNKFFECSNGLAFEITCPPDLHFNPELQVCDFPDEAGCQANKFMKIILAVENKKKRSDDLDPRCPETDDPDKPFYFPHESDCNKFFECSNGLAFEINCPPDLHFNPELQVCDFPDEAGCQANKFMKIILAVEHKKKRSDDLDPRCPETDDPDKPFYFPHESDCNKFFECSNGLAFEINCPPDLHFNPELQVCDFPDEAGCQASKFMKFTLARKQ